MPIGLVEDFKEVIEGMSSKFVAAGIITRDGLIYPLGSDTKVLSTVFELISRPYIYEIAEKYGLGVIEPESQNHYPDFTLYTPTQPRAKIALDVKTTYRKPNKRFSYTLGGYTSFIREGNDTKNIVFPFSDYSMHLVLGFVYDRVVTKKAALHQLYMYNEYDIVPLPFENVEVFINEKWRISSDRAGSGNTTNIGSITGTIEDFRNGKGVFESEEEFLQYWKNYERTQNLRSAKFGNVHEFRAWKKELN